MGWKAVAVLNPGASYWSLWKTYFDCRIDSVDSVYYKYYQKTLFI
jgi:hypothetical protein